MCRNCTVGLAQTCCYSGVVELVGESFGRVAQPLYRRFFGCPCMRLRARIVRTVSIT
jgi:hypothetical protein